jgi:hypothetical protein
MISSRRTNKPLEMATHKRRSGSLAVVATARVCKCSVSWRCRDTSQRERDHQKQQQRLRLLRLRSRRQHGLGTGSVLGRRRATTKGVVSCSCASRAAWANATCARTNVSAPRRKSSSTGSRPCQKQSLHNELAIRLGGGPDRSPRVRLSSTRCGAAARCA